MIRFTFQILLFLTPLFALILGSSVVLPVDFFAFRVWEGAIVAYADKILPGPFYPGLHVQRVEYGDLGPHTPWAVEKHVEWRTDQWGYRKAPGGSDPWDIVLIGDSSVVGTGLTQGDILSEQLERRLDARVYPLAPAEVPHFARDARFGQKPPRVVIVSRIERRIPLLPSAEGLPLLREMSAPRFESAQYLYGPAVLLDRIAKRPLLQWLRAGLQRSIESPWFPKRAYETRDGKMLFMDALHANDPLDEASYQKALRVVEGYHAWFESQAIEFIFLPVPNKENLYHHDLGTGAPSLIPRLVADLKARGIHAIDTQSAFHRADTSGIGPLFHVDDTHWNAVGVGVATDLLVDELSRYFTPETAVISAMIE